MLFLNKDVLVSWGPAALNLILSGVLIYFVYQWMDSKNKRDREKAWMRQILFGLMVIFLVAGVIVSFPIASETRDMVFKFLGGAITAVFAFSSTSLVGNSMAALALKLIDGIRPGDFLTVGEHSGRISEQGLLHTEIQTEERRLTTIPNLYLITNPHTVVRSTGTIVSATVSLGYDVSRFKIEKALIEAANRTGLKDAYVQVIELGDFSVSYRIAGFLEKVKFLISVRSQLMGNVLDVLHESNIEIVSPNFMNQRPLGREQVFIPQVTQYEKKQTEDLSAKPEDLIFDKAEEAESKEDIKNASNKIHAQIAENEEKLKNEELLEEEREKITKRIENLKKRDLRLMEMLERFE
ncbi:MAG: mechanosensitive ion channel family protein [Bdellovibrionales bacterium]